MKADSELFCYNASYTLIYGVINMSRCGYCRKQGTEKQTAIRFWDQRKRKQRTLELGYCSDACKQNIHDFANLHNKYGPSFSKISILFLFLFAIIPFSLRAITGYSFWVDIVSPVVMAVIGLVLIRYPLGLSSIKYYQRFGIKYITLAIRLTGLIILLSAADLLWVALK
jgi:hypothetical protein